MTMDNRLKPIKALENYSFTVNKYQRGYKWGIQEVEDLLHDIRHFDPSVQSFYCLQPIVVKNIGNNSYELIDGQQRLTTAYIILQCLGTKLFDLEYRTRPQSADFLKQINTLEIIDLGTSPRTEINLEWTKYITERSEADNIDNYHFFTVYQIIINWLNRLELEVKQLFYDKLCNHTKVIWYEIISQQTPEEIFINFNQGKIHLEQAELIKALFVLQLKEESNIELRTHLTNQFADEWNTIENQLQDDKFWYFFSNDISDKKKANRIDLLFDIICRKPKKEQNVIFSYHKYLKKFNDQSLNKDNVDWKEIKNLYNLIFEWYQDRNIYHLLGLMVYLEIKTIAEVYDLYKDLNNKDLFEHEIKQSLRNLIKYDAPDNKYNISTLSYQSYKETLNLLLVFNVATYQISDFNYRFPFDKLKTQRWSLEHIHAQKADEFLIIEETRDWIEDIKPLLNELEDSNDIKERITTLENEISQFNDADNISKELKIRTKEINNLFDKKMNVDRISNLCLLDGSTNSALGNLNFRKKREKILSIDMDGEVQEQSHNKTKAFIPICTKNAFLKYYTQKSDDIQFSYWGITDRNDYEKALEKVIRNYLK